MISVTYTKENMLMNKQQFDMNIQAADNNSLRIGAANRIVQLLQKLRYSNNENSAKRWVWELCQNAKDVCNSTGKVKISINYDEMQRKVFFRHNGKAFSMDNILSLINQASSKDRNDGSERKSGKFGTGFITTHLLSEVVNISGLLEIGDEYSKFTISLDRTGKEKNEIITAMEKAVGDLESCTPVDFLDFDEDEYNTVFEYELDEYGMKTARDGLESLRASAAYVLAMLHDIEEITVENTGEKFRYKREVNCVLENATVSEIEVEQQGHCCNKYVLGMTEDNASIYIALERTNDNMKILPFYENQSKLFCDFPLIGTEDFPFPVLISSPDFNPTEPRDGVFLTCKNTARIDEEIEVNRSIIEKACGLYEHLLEYVAKKKWDGIYNISNVNAYSKKEWYDEEWLDEIIAKCKDVILHTPIIRNACGDMKALIDSWDEQELYIISDRNVATREKIWTLLSYMIPDMIPQKEDLHEWYQSLWSGCNSYTFERLSEQVSSFATVDTLDAELNRIDWRDWLNKYYEIIDENEKWQTFVQHNQLNILPNQREKFCCVDSLYYDIDILEEYKEILTDLGNDIKARLLHLEFERSEWFCCEEINNGQILELIETQLEQGGKEEKETVCQKITFMYNDSFADIDSQKKICHYVNSILKLGLELHEVKAISEKLLRESLKYMTTMVADRISECSSLEGLAEYIGTSKAEAAEYLAGFIEFVVKKGWDNLINKITKPILPNQNGNFTIKENIFLDNEMDETLKDIACIAGHDIREELLMKEIYLELPENRQKTNKDIAGYITEFVQDNRNTKEPEIRSAFHKLLLWIKDYQSEAENILPILYANKHYLYDDDDIANNIRQAETFTNIMSKYDIDSPEQLEAIIRQGTKGAVVDMDLSKEVITEEVLLQYGIDSKEALDRAFSDSEFSSLFIRESGHEISTYEYVKKILDRAQKNVLSYLDEQEEYDLSDKQKIADTIYVVKKNGKQIYVLARPSDGGEVRIYYRTEMDILDYSMDWELWVEDGKKEPQKITFGKIIKLTGLNRIPLKGM